MSDYLQTGRDGAAVYEHILSVILEHGQEIAGKVHSVSRFTTKYGDVPAILFQPGEVSHTLSDEDIARLCAERSKPFPEGVTPNLGMIGIGTILADRLAPVRAGDILYVKRVDDAYSEEYATDYPVFTVMIDDGRGMVPAQNMGDRPLNVNVQLKMDVPDHDEKPF